MRVIVITGTSHGLGLVVAQNLVKLSDTKLVTLNRCQKSADQSASSILKIAPKADLDSRVLDLFKTDTVTDVARELTSCYRHRF